MDAMTGHSIELGYSLQHLKLVDGVTYPALRLIFESRLRIVYTDSSAHGHLARGESFRQRDASLILREW